MSEGDHKRFVAFIIIVHIIIVHDEWYNNMAGVHSTNEDERNIPY